MNLQLRRTHTFDLEYRQRTLATDVVYRVLDEEVACGRHSTTINTGGTQPKCDNKNFQTEYLDTHGKGTFKNDQFQL